MKKLAKTIDFLYVPWAIKIICVIVFIFNTQIPSAMYNEHKQSSLKTSELYPGYYSVNGQNLSIAERQCRLERFCYQLYQKAETKALKSRYLAEDYIMDKIKIHEKENELKAPLIGFDYIRFIKLSEESYATHREFSKEIDEALKKYIDKLNKFEQRFVSPNKTEDPKIIIKKIKNWLTRVYSTSFIFALIYFLVLRRQECEEKGKKFSLRSPVSFCLALIFYPVVFIYLINRWMKYAYASIEYRRTRRNIFNVLSDDEITRIKIIARNIPVTQIREYFGVQGLTRRHSFTAALLVVLVFSFVPRPMQAKIVDFGDSAFNNIEASWHSPRSKIKADTNHSQPDTLKFKASDCIIPKPIREFKDISCWLEKLEFIFCFQAVCQKIIHVPIFFGYSVSCEVITSE